MNVGFQPWVTLENLSSSALACPVAERTGVPIGLGGLQASPINDTLAVSQEFSNWTVDIINRSEELQRMQCTSFMELATLDSVQTATHKGTAHESGS
jgi:hypothetical protein